MQEPIYTSDGSATLYSRHFDENYHSVKCGAFNESMQKHILPAFAFAQHFPKTINILDVCFGLGYNTFCAILYAAKHNLSLNITSPEIDEELLKQLLDFDYPAEFNELKAFIVELITNKKASYKNCSVEIIIGDFRQTIKRLDKKYDIIFQDPFSPKKNRSLWSIEYFTEVFNLASDFCIMTTYSQSSAVRLSMKKAGFLVFDLPLQEPIRSGTIASKKILDGYKQIDLEHKLKYNPNLEAIYD